MKEIYAFLSLDEAGQEGFVLVQIKPDGGDTTLVQLIAPTKDLADQYKMWAETVAKTTGKRIRLVRFSNPEELEVIG